MSVMGDALSRAQVAALLTPGGVYRSAQRISLPMATTVVLNTAIAANTMYAFPIPMAAGASISGVAIQVGTAVAATSAKLGLALSGPDGRPGPLVAEAPTPVDMNSTALAELVALFTAPQFAPAGVVWGLCVFNGLAQPVTIGAFSSGSQFVGHLIGAISINNYTAQGGTVRLTRTHTYADAFPASLTGWTATAGANPSSPIMAAVVA